MQKIKTRGVFSAVLLSILSLVFPGIGHLFGGRFRRFMLSLLLFVILALLSGVMIGAGYYRFGVAMLYFFIVGWFGFLVVDSYMINRNKVGITMRWYSKWYFYILGIILLYFLANVAACVISTSGIRPFRIAGDGNSPTIQKNDHVIAKMNYGKKRGFSFIQIELPGSTVGTVPFVAFHSPKYSVGDIVIFKRPGETFWRILRIVALSGDRFEIRDGRDYVNGKAVENYNIISANRHKPRAMNFKQIKVPENSVFLLGDYRDQSEDCRDFGPLPLKALSGKVLFVVWSANFKRIGRLL